MRVTISAATLILLLCSLAAQADELATTDSGRRVVLHDDYTWEYVEPSDPAEAGSYVVIGDTNARLEIVAHRDDAPQARYMEAAEGMKLLGVELRIDNSEGTGSLDMSWMLGIGIEMRDTDGYVYEITMSSRGQLVPELPLDREVEAGDIVRGWVTFEVRNEVTPAQVQVRYASRKAKSPWLSVSRLPQE